MSTMSVNEPARPDSVQDQAELKTGVNVPTPSGRLPVPAAQISSVDIAGGGLQHPPPIQSVDVSAHVVEDDGNPRSPKRRRITPALEMAQDARDAPRSPVADAGDHDDGSPSSGMAHSAELSRTISPHHPARGHIIEHSSVTTVRTRFESLPVLDNLSAQILAFLAGLSPTEAMSLSRAPDTPRAREYTTLRSLFELTRRLYATNSPFLSAQDLGLRESNHIEIIRRANQAIFMSSIFTGEIGLRDMDRHFIHVFVPENGRLLKAQASIFLELKTQAFITAWRTGAANPSMVMVDLFPSNLDTKLLEKRAGTKSLAPSEQDFLKRLSSRRDILWADIKGNTLDQLPTRYKWEDFSREVSSYLAKNFGSTSAGPIDRTAANLGSGHSTPLRQGQMESHFSIHAPAPPRPSDAVGGTSASTPQSRGESIGGALDDFVAQAARAAEIAMQEPSELGYSSSHQAAAAGPAVHTEPTKFQPVEAHFQYYNPPAAEASSTHSTSGTPSVAAGVPHSSQTAPTQVLYERARQAASSKSSPTARKAATPSQRRPWTTEEENALMTGLDHVKGPHWSRILAMYGPGGTVNESLKDRNQVQLKDKARNLKLFFLKAGIEVPYYLKYVTGDLKTRAPAQASKQEARERERLESEEAKAHFDGLQGIMALAGGGQHAHHATDSSPASTEPRSPVTTAPAATATENAPQPPAVQQPSMLDVEAMIARAAAQASQSLDHPTWNGR